MDDIDGLLMAERIYKRIVRDGRLNVSTIPFAVAEAARELRESGVPVSRWSIYIHLGV